MALSRRSLAAIVGIAVILLLLLSLPIVVAPRIKERLVNALGERFESTVQLESLTVSLLPRPRLSGRGLVLRHKHRTDVPPLVTIASFSGEAGLVGLLGDPVRVSNIHLEGLEINVPPGGMSLDDDEPDDADDNDSGKSPLIVRNLRSERAVLRILRKKPGKAPRVFEIFSSTCKMSARTTRGRSARTSPTQSRLAASRRKGPSAPGTPASRPARRWRRRTVSRTRTLVSSTKLPES